jgi:tRNA threonylcarbamoyladenosine biosynthesis protein TsaE
VKLEFNNIGLSDLNHVAEKIISVYNNDRIFCFYGIMGSGKTTLIKSICNYLGVKNLTSSPTFSIVNEYITIKNEILYHFDFYRIKSISEVYDIGYEDYFFSGNYCFIEWPEKISELLSIDFVKIDIKETSDNSLRTIICNK